MKKITYAQTYALRYAGASEQANTTYPNSAAALSMFMGISGSPNHMWRFTSTGSNMDLVGSQDFGDSNNGSVAVAVHPELGEALEFTEGSNTYLQGTVGGTASTLAPESGSYALVLVGDFSEADGTLRSVWHQEGGGANIQVRVSDSVVQLDLDDGGGTAITMTSSVGTAPPGLTAIMVVIDKTEGIARLWTGTGVDEEAGWAGGAITPTNQPYLGSDGDSAGMTVSLGAVFKGSDAEDLLQGNGTALVNAMGLNTPAAVYPLTAADTATAMGLVSGPATLWRVKGLTEDPALAGTGGLTSYTDPAAPSKHPFLGDVARIGNGGTRAVVHSSPPVPGIDSYAVVLVGHFPSRNEDQAGKDQRYVYGLPVSGSGTTFRSRFRDDDAVIFAQIDGTNYVKVATGGDYPRETIAIGFVINRTTDNLHIYTSDGLSDSRTLAGTGIALDLGSILFGSTTVLGRWYLAWASVWTGAEAEAVDATAVSNLATSIGIS